MTDDTGRLKKLLEDGADPNGAVTVGSPEVSPLAVHCLMGRPMAVRLLLQFGADSRIGREATGETPLHHAVASDVTGEEVADIVEQLLTAGVDVNATTVTGLETANFMWDARTRGETPLHRAAAFATPDVVQLLIEQGADKTIKDANGDSALSWASWYKRSDDVLNLLTYGDFVTNLEQTEPESDDSC